MEIGKLSPDPHLNNRLKRPGVDGKLSEDSQLVLPENDRFAVLAYTASYNFIAELGNVPWTCSAGLSARQVGDNCVPQRTCIGIRSVPPASLRVSLQGSVPLLCGIHKAKQLWP